MSDPDRVGYEGRDRRAVSRGLEVDGRSLVLWTIAGVGGLILLAATLAFATPGATIDLWPVALAFWCTAVLGSGVALLLAWRIGGWARPGQLGAALVAVSLLVSFVPRFSDLVASIERLRSVRPLATTVVMALAVAHVVRSLRRADIDTAVKPVRELLELVGLMLLGALAGVTLLLVSPGLQSLIGWGPPAVCAFGAFAVVMVRHRAPRAVTRGVAGALMLMALGGFLHRVSGLDLVQAAAAAAMCSAGWVFVGIARDRLRVAFAMQDARSLQTLATLGRYSSEVSHERERRHDALNALAAIRSAAEVLAAQGQQLDQATRAELSLAARSELARVERLLDAAGPSQPRDVLLADVLRPVLLARTHSGLTVETHVGEAGVRAVPDVVARIIDNLLQNAERHAPGASVRLEARQRDGQVELSVTDAGPGIPVQRRGALFDVGVSSSPRGHGLGLPSALRLARSQGGDLRLATGDHGCRFVLTLPATPILVPSSASAARPSRLQALRAEAG